MGNTVPRRHSMARPAISPDAASSAGTAATISSASAVSMWCSTTPSSWRNHQALIWVSTAPFSGIGSAITTSKALTRSLATSSSRSASTS